MDHDTLPPATARGRLLRRMGEWLEASPAELAGLTVLLLGAAAAAVAVWWTAAPRPGPAPPVPVRAEEPTAVTVHVAGAVATPGLVRLEAGARVADAVAAAGGALAGAGVDALNLARVVEDGEQIVVPATPAGPATAAIAAGSGRRPDGRLDLNHATAAELEELPGIGPVLAERIVAWREANGPFREVGQLRDVPGIGERTFQNLADEVTV